MTISVLQAAAFDGPGEIAVWAAERGHEVHLHHLYRGDPLPEPNTFDLLVVMGGEMNVYQYREYPWLKPTRNLIHSTLLQGKRIVGICLGAQLIADALGARVTQNAEHEIGWVPVAWTQDAYAVFPELPPNATVLQWHGDTFELPVGATRLATSEACLEQGFVIRDVCLGLQFHPEVNLSLLKQFVNSQGHWPSGSYTQTPETILGEAGKHAEKNRQLLHSLLDRFCHSG
jgi:GMP synthase-like glutamine amidotransferase